LATPEISIVIDKEKKKKKKKGKHSGCGGVGGKVLNSQETVKWKTRKGRGQGRIYSELHKDTDLNSLGKEKVGGQDPAGKKNSHEHEN